MMVKVYVYMMCLIAIPNRKSGNSDTHKQANK